MHQALVSMGQQFGKDASKWNQVGESDVKVSSTPSKSTFELCLIPPPPCQQVTEEGGQRVFRTTAVLMGVELSLFIEPWFYDARWWRVVREVAKRFC